MGRKVVVSLELVYLIWTSRFCLGFINGSVTPSNVFVNFRYNGWLDAIRSIWMVEGAHGMFRGSIPRITWYIPASALTFMAVEFLRDHFNEGLSNPNSQDVASMLVEKKGSPLQGAA